MYEVVRAGIPVVRSVPISIWWSDWSAIHMFKGEVMQGIHLPWS